jgi:ABC-type Na+ transport system ATPase subunit NatA
VLGLLGPNGAGKSTTVKILTTLSLPDSGSARVAGVDVLAEPDRVRRSIGLVGQRSGVDLEATGRENLTLQGQVYGLRGTELRSRVGELLERFGLAEAADRVARGYSGGMQRRLDIAMGLIHRPQVLFLDEPTTGLDPEVRAGTWAEIAHLSAGEGLTILLTTHYLEEADRLAGRLAIVSVIQSAIVITLGLLAGAHFPGGATGLAVLVISSALLGASLGALSNGMALLARKEATVIAASNFILLPLTFLSSAFMQRNLVPGWIQTISRYNPVEWTVTAGREALTANPDWGLVLSRLELLVALAAVCTWLATPAFRTYQRTI